MYCLKCGNETETEQVFCTHCLEVMEKYPVKNGTPARIPNRDANMSTKKQIRRRTHSAEEQIIRLKAAVRTLIALLGSALVVLGIFIWLYMNEVNRVPENNESSKGTNYHVIDQEPETT